MDYQSITWCCGRSPCYKASCCLVWTEMDRRIRKGLVKEMTFEVDFEWPVGAGQEDVLIQGILWSEILGCEKCLGLSKSGKTGWGQSVSYEPWLGGWRMICKWSRMRVIAGFSFLFNVDFYWSIKCILQSTYIIIIQLDKLSQVNTHVYQHPDQETEQNITRTPEILLCPLLVSCPLFLLPVQHTGVSLILASNTVD